VELRELRLRKRRLRRKLKSKWTSSLRNRPYWHPEKVQAEAELSKELSKERLKKVPYMARPECGYLEEKEPSLEECEELNRRERGRVFAQLVKDRCGVVESEEEWEWEGDEE